jgi:hypothetical protein
MGVCAASANVACVLECASIVEFCTANEIAVPSIIQESWADFWGAIKNFFKKIADWFKSLVKGTTAVFAKAKITELIAKLKTLDGNKVVKIDTNIGAMLFATEFIYLELENFKEKCIDNIPEQSTVDDLIEELEKIVAVKKWDAATIATFRSPGTGTKLGSEVKGPTVNGNDEIEISDIIKALEEINRMNMPKRGSALLKSLKFDEKKYVEDDDKNEGKEKVNRELVNSIKKLSRLLAKGYDKITSGLVKVTEIAFHNEKVDEKSDAYKENLKEAQEARKNKVDYNKDEDSSNRPKLESAVEEPESAETETVTESAKVDSTDAYFD